MSKSGRKNSRPQSRLPARAMAAPTITQKPIQADPQKNSAPAADSRNDLPVSSAQLPETPLSRLEIWAGAAARGLPAAITLYMVYIGAITLGTTFAATAAIVFAGIGIIAPELPTWTKRSLQIEWVGSLNIFRYSLFFAALGLLAWISWSLSHIELVSLFAVICFVCSAIVCVAAQRYT